MSEGHLLILGILLIIFLGCSAFFSGSETALMAVGKLRLKHLAASRPKRVRLVEELLEKPDRLIGTILLGNNLVNVAMSAVATALAMSVWGEKGIIYVTVGLTIVILIFCEITPKIYAKYFNERMSFFSAPILKVVTAVSAPIVTLVTFLSHKLLLLTGIDMSKIEKPLMTEAEVRTCIQVGWDEGAVTDEERKLLTRVFRLNDKSVAEIMVPREKMATLDLNASIKETIEKVIKTGFSRFPVMTSKTDEVVGVIHAKDLFKIVGDGTFATLEKIILPASFVSADEKIDAQLRRFKALKKHQAIVINQENTPIGLITLEDTLEELVGSIQDEHD
jgi:Mg2+/Co2+ transporter CorB